MLKNIMISLIFVFSLFFGCQSNSEISRIKTLAKYEPPEDKILVFAGQDNESVGGNDRFNDGYTDNIDIPAGITHYIGFGEFDSTSGKLRGLNIESDWQAGPMCLKYYLDSEVYKKSIIHLSIAMVDVEQQVAKGELDDKIFEVADFMNTYKDRPFLVRIGYEFDGEWNHYDTTAFVEAFRRTVDKFREKNVANFATVLATSSLVVPYQVWEKYYPGDDYVDWCGYSYWEGTFPESSAIQFARDHSKPVFIGEITPRGHFFNKENGEQLWDDWFIPFFNHLDQYKDVIKAISYINCNWDAQGMWKGQG